MTHYEEQKILDFEVYKLQERLKKVSRDFKHVQIKSVKVVIGEPAKVKAKLWYQFWKK